MKATKPVKKTPKKVNPLKAFKLKKDDEILGRIVKATDPGGFYSHSKLNKKVFIDNLSFATKSTLEETILAQSHAINSELNQTYADQASIKNSKCTDLEILQSWIDECSIKGSTLVYQSKLMKVDTTKNTKIKQSVLYDVIVSNPGDGADAEIERCELENCSIAGIGKIVGVKAKNKAIILMGDKKPKIESLIINLPNGDNQQ